MPIASVATLVCIITCVTIAVGTLEPNGSVHDMILQMIAEHHEMCPYVSLCKKSNSSTFKKLSDSWVPCCSQCSCENDCIEHGTCCPDFYENDKKRTFDTMSNIYNKTLKYQLKCVQVSYGLNNSADGYEMVADCQRNYTNSTTKRHCDSNFDTSVEGTKLDNVPIYDQSSGISYKNRNCYLCNNDLVGNVQFWDIRFVCFGPFNFFSSEISSPLYIVHKLQKDKFCNVMFHVAQQDTNNVRAKLVECVSDSHIRSCKPDYVGTRLEYLCFKYTWPLTVNYRIYKNYACMLCNDVSFMEPCFTSGKDFFVFKGSIKLSHFGVLSSSTNQDTSYSINKLFPDSFGNACPQGFVLDNRRAAENVFFLEMNMSPEVLLAMSFINVYNMYQMKTLGFGKQRSYNCVPKICCNVACPFGFFVKDGDCLPYFEDLTGIAYTSIVEILLPNTLYGTDTSSLEHTMIAVINQTLQRCIKEGNFIFRLLSNSRTSGIVDSNRKYYIHFYIINQDNFYALPKILYKFVVLEGLMKITFGGNIDREVTVKLHFPGAFFIHGLEAFNSRGKKLYSVEHIPLKEMLLNIKQRVLTVGKSVICYRAALNSSDIKYVGREMIQVLETKNVLSSTNFHSDNSNKMFVCLEDAFGGKPKYIFDDPETDKKEKIKKIHTSENVLTKTSKVNIEMLSRSLVAIACSVGLLVCVFGMRKILRYLQRCKANQDVNVNHDTL